LGNYLNELVCDNAYPLEPGIKYYMKNWPTDAEIEYLTRNYVQLANKGDNTFEWSLEADKCEQCVSAVRQTKQNMILNSYYWAVWAIMMLTEKDESDSEAFFWDFLDGRSEMHMRYIKQFGFG